MTADPRAKELRQELLDAVEARGEALKNLNRAESIRIGPFGGQKVREAEDEYHKACERVTEAYDAWYAIVPKFSFDDLFGEEP